MANPVAFPNRPFNLRMNYWTISQNVAGNYSTLGWQLWVDKTSYSPTFSGEMAHRWMKVNGTFVHESYGNGFDFRDGTNFLLGSGSINVAHNADGTKTVAFEADADFAILGATPTATASAALATIPRASTPSIANPQTRDIGTSITISTNRASSAFTHTLEYSFAGGAYVEIGTGIGTSVDWTPPLSLIDDIPNAASSPVTIRTKTYNGATLIGTTTKNFTLAVPTSYVPDFTTILNTEATSGVAANIGKYVQSISTLALEISGEAGVEGSTITARKIEVLSGATVLQTINADSGTTLPITVSGTVTLRGTVTDSRGRTQVKTVDVDVLAYAPPVLNAIDVQRSLSDGTVDVDDGTYLRVNIDASGTSLMNTTERNSLNWRISSRNYGGSSWTVEDTGAFPSMTFDSFKVAGTFSLTQAYDILVEIFDDFTTSAVIISIPVAAIFMHWKGSDGVGIGKYLEDGMLDVAGDIYQSNGNPVRSLIETLYFTSSDTFEKADYPWLKAIRVRVQAGGGSGGAVAAAAASQNSHAAGGGGGGYAESFITDIAGLSSSITVTVGAGGAGQSAGANAGAAGGASSFGSLVAANGGGGGATKGSSVLGGYLPGGVGGAGTAGEIMITGGGGGSGFGADTLASGGAGGSSHMGGGGAAVGSGAGSGGGQGIAGGQYGGGGGGASANAGSVARPSLAGGAGIVIVELFG